MRCLAVATLMMSNLYQTLNIGTVALFVTELYRNGISAWGGKMGWDNPVGTDVQCSPRRSILLEPSFLE
jgi:hypothetical protein